ncbi:MAG: hypothetical protein WC378_08400 [Opitutaceae bacterium]
MPLTPPMIRTLYQAFLAMALSSTTLCAGSASTGTSAWNKTTFLNEAAWSSRQGEIMAIVSEVRCRLLYLGAADGSLNLLSAPSPRPIPTTSIPAPNWGGHRFWLGPQKRWVWPPISDWEFAPASSVRAKGAVLIMEHLCTDKNYPALTREYAWEGTRIRCTVRWKDDGRAYYGMHVIAIDVPAEIPVLLKRTEDRPLGLVFVEMNGCKTEGFLPHPAFRDAGGKGTLVSGSPKSFKCGLAPQPLRVARAGGWTLTAHPGPTEGATIGSSDAGYLSQIWVGDSHATFAELEQISPILLGDDSGKCSSTCYIEATAPGK